MGLRSSPRGLSCLRPLSQRSFLFRVHAGKRCRNKPFGFSDERERMLFLELLEVKTVGGKLAVTLLRHLDADQILQAIVSGSSSMLTVPVWVQRGQNAYASN